MIEIYYLAVLMVRVVLPAGLLLSIALRPYGLSVIYLLLYLIAPLPEVPDSHSFGGCQGRFLLINLLVSLLLLTLHSAWHVVLAAFGPYGSILTSYPIIQKIGHNLGLVTYSKIDPWMAVHFLAPELVMTTVSLLVFAVIKKLVTNPNNLVTKKRSKHRKFPIMTSAGKYLCLFLIMFSAILRPSVTSGIYFLTFIGIATAWSLGKPLEKGFAVVARCLMAIMAVHVIVLLIYQCMWIVDFYPPDRAMARYFGLTKLVIFNETIPNRFAYEVTEDHMWATLASPLVILITYYILALETKELFKPKAKRKIALTGVESGKLNGSMVRGISFHNRRAARDKWTSATKKARVAFSYISSKVLRGRSSETETLLRAPSKRWSALSESTTKYLHQDSTGSVIVSDNESMVNHEPTLMDDIMAAFIDFFQVLIRSSYIATTITMMAWSIMYHSWLTFVLLMWANLVWLCQDQRSFMLKTSPVLVVYAILLLLGEYVYGMNLTETELPSTLADVNLQQIGLGHPKNEPCVPLLIKSLFTCMFWVTLRQRVQEIRQRRKSAIITDMAAPLQLTVSTAASVAESTHPEPQSRLMAALGAWLRALCARYWIYVVVIMLFVIGVTGERMTIFRILYMFLFLSFILMFQISWYWWRRLMYVFWIVVIIYSMINLILIYIYQFDNFSKSIEKYLFINEKLQHDLGLDRYHPADLFVKLLTPTLFLIITIMQVHYFHKHFMELSEFKPSVAKEPESSRPSQTGASTMKDDLPPLPSEGEQQNSLNAPQPQEAPLSLDASRTDADNSIEMSSLNTNLNKQESAQRKASRSIAPTITDRPSTAFKDVALRLFHSSGHFLHQCMDKGFKYLDLHLVKIIFLALMILCAVNVCAMHVPIMLIISPALWLSSRKQRLCVLFISTLVSIYLMAKMVYQIDYIQHSYFDVNCTTVSINGTNNVTTYNNAEWIGFVKATYERPFVVLIKGYIGLIAVFTFYALVTYRQRAIREQGLLPKESEKIMFPEVTRNEADIDILHCIKYLINYGFYKFGVEITLICLMGVVGSRMDVYAAVYAGWLLALVSARRGRQQALWPAFAACTTVLVPAQYMIAVGFLPQFCIHYPWAGNDQQIKHIRNWLFLPYADEPPHAVKVIFDYFLLLFATRQLRVFKIERTIGDNYKGGSNSENIGQDWETPSFVNPVPDFLGAITSWLDVIKRLVFLGMLWVTLAIMFMTGTNRVNLFSMGYLIGSFIFLWQGTDFYLRPKAAILRWWSWLVRYNVGVVVVKTLLQIPGCMFNTVMQDNACWLVQLLGIGCVDKFAGGNIAHFIKMSYVKEAVCSVPQEDIGLAWDGVCFAFLILQQRLFHSYYFYRVIDESKATTVLASRGAELIEELRLKQMKVQEDQEVKILEKIKIKMERIKANQKKIQGAFPKEPRHHDCGGEAAPGPRRVFTKRHEVRDRPPYKPPASHQKAVRSGDYYMFDEFDDTEIPVKDEESSSDEDAPKEMGFGKLLSTVIKTDLKAAVRRASAPNVRRASHDLAAHPLSYPTQSRRRSSRDTIVREDDVALTERDGDQPMSAIEDYAALGPENETFIDKLKVCTNTVKVFINSFLATLTRHLMKYSRDYRYVSRTLFTEKKVLKEKEGFGMGVREGSQMIWEPFPLAHRKFGSTLEEHEDSLFQQERTQIVYLIYALWYGFLAHTDIMCYIMVFINQIQSATILSIPLPLMVFLWGTLTIPRPTKTFWVTLIAYTEVIVLIKSMFQFEILPWNQKAIPANMPFTAPRIIGIERKYNYALYDLLLLLVIFLHRFMLKSLGLWKESTPDIELRQDMNYRLTPEDTRLIIEGRGEEVGKKYVKLHDETGPGHRLVDRFSHVEAAIRTAMRNLQARRSDPRLARYVWHLIHKRNNSWSSEGHERAREDSQAQARHEARHEVRYEAAPSPSQAELRAAARDEAEAGPSRPPDMDEISLDDDQEPIIAVTTTLEEPYKHFPQIMLLSVKRYLRPVRSFFKRMLEPGARVTADVYAYMFLCDFFNFLVVIFGFAAFGTHQGDGGVQAYLEENKVPIPFLIMLILQFALIIIDRALYLRKFMLGKILFQYGLIIGVHIWMFFVLPFITERTFNSLMPPPMWYMMKCVYLLLSAYQIRCGYPRRIIGNFLCKSYTFINMVCFRGFMAVPFVFELRTLMDWIWTDTSMTLMDWLKMEDIFASVYLLKCSRYVEDEYPQARGAKKSNTTKYLLGGSVLAFVIAIIWFPLVFFAFGNTVGEPNPPTDVTVKIRIGPFLPVYQMSAQSHNIDIFTEQDYAQLSNLYARDRTAQTFLSNYMYNDVAVITINPNSTMKWQISPPELQRLEMEAMSNASLVVKFTYVITHVSNAVPNPPVMDDSREVALPALAGGRRSAERDKLLALLDGSAPPDTWINVQTLFPKFVKVFNKGSTKPAYQLMPIPPGSEDEITVERMYRNVQLRLERDNDSMYWRVRESCTNPDPLTAIPMNNCDMLIMYTFNDKLFPETLNFISGSGIIGLYTTFVFLASRVLRGFFSGIYTKIMFDDLPNVDRVLQLCLDIYLVREALELRLEEDLFAKLVFLYRSPETMIKWSRPKEEPEAPPPLPPSH